MNRHAAYPVLPLAVLRLTGSQVEMGRQHGALQRTLGGHEAALDYYRPCRTGSPPRSTR
jgi:hypothetical protein